MSSELEATAELNSTFPDGESINSRKPPRSAILRPPSASHSFLSLSRAERKSETLFRASGSKKSFAFLSSLVLRLCFLPFFSQRRFYFRFGPSKAVFTWGERVWRKQVSARVLELDPESIIALIAIPIAGQGDEKSWTSRLKRTWSRTWSHHGVSISRESLFERRPSYFCSWIFDAAGSSRELSGWKRSDYSRLVDAFVAAARFTVIDQRNLASLPLRTVNPAIALIRGGFSAAFMALGFYAAP